MSKNRDSSQRSARALKRLETHNESPKDIVESEESDGNQNQPREDSSHRRLGSKSRHRSMEVEEPAVVVARLAVDTNTASHLGKRIVTHGLTNGVDMNDLEANILVRLPAKASPPPQRGPGRP